MTDHSPPPTPPLPLAGQLRRLNGYALLLTLLWTGALLSWGVYHRQSQTDQVRALAHAEAQAAYTRDVLYRLWSTSHGGVYVPVSDASPPNPHLEHIAERDILTPSGRQLTLLNPAYMTRQVYELGRQRFGVMAHITSLDPLRWENAPDAWEERSLHELAKGTGEVTTLEERNGETILRLIRPFHAEKTCLKCHAFQGYALGELLGGISVGVPLAPYRAMFAAGNRLHYFFLGGVWLFGIGGVLWARLNFARWMRGNDRRERLLAASEHRYRVQNEELETLIYIASHDLRSPLVNIDGFSRRLARACDDLRRLLTAPALPPQTQSAVEPLLAETIPRSLDYIQSSAKKMDDLINALLALSRVGRRELVPQTVDMNRLLAEVAADHRFQLEQTASELRIAPLPPCLGDRQQLSQVFSNLLDNAIKYRAPDRPSRIAIDGWVWRDEAHYRISDQGRGIAPANLGKIFDIFYREDPRGTPGDGLGLALIQRIVQRHGGRVGVESDAGGSRFLVTLPQAPSPDHEPTGERP